MKQKKITIFWFRRDLRLTDNAAFSAATQSGLEVLPIFIFDTAILGELENNDARVSFIYKTLNAINDVLKTNNRSIKVMLGEPLKIWKQLIDEFPVAEIYFNKDYEPYALKRDFEIAQYLTNHGVKTKTFKDQVIFEEFEILKSDGKPYTIFTPYKNKWREKFKPEQHLIDYQIDLKTILQENHYFPTINEIGFSTSTKVVVPFNLKNLDRYAEIRNLPSDDATSYLSPHLRFGTVSIRQIIRLLQPRHELFLNELVWREFFMQILFHFPKVVNQNFKPQYDGIKWRNNETEFNKWSEGKTGYPLVDAGMQQLNKTGYMHNRVRMVVASFLCKHLLIDWRWGEAYFAKHLLDYDLSANNGNWQWAAGTGCDAAPYFRIFNPSEQL